jgi:3'(2'), 5'-bisphosphate nucleotidase
MTHDPMEPGRAARAKGFLDPRLIDELTALVSRAAAAVMDVRSSALAVRQKPDASPVTAADEASEEIIADGLRRLLPGLDVVSEEAAARSAPRSVTSAFALVDPLDGTREFIAGHDDFAINLAVIAEGRPVFGLVAAPALQLIWRSRAGGGAERLRLAPGAPLQDARDKIEIHTAIPSAGRLRAVVSRSHLDERTTAWLARRNGVELMPCGSALKFCRVAEGTADIYPRLAPTMEWDVAAGDAVLTAAGGGVFTPDGEPLVYGQTGRGLRIPDFIAWGSPPAAGKNSR